MRPGGQPYDLPQGWVERCGEFIAEFPAKVDEYEDLLTENRIWKRRTVGIGVLPPETAIAYGVTGPMLRGSGVDWDLRKALPYEAYGEVEFDVPVFHNCDTYDRYLVRIEEMRQSARIIRQCLDRLPDGPIMAKRPRVLKAAAATEAYHAVEGPKGELGFYIVSDGSARPYRIKVRPPCFPIFSTFSRLMEGHTVSDVIATLGGLNIIAGELDR